MIFILAAFWSALPAGELLALFHSPLRPCSYLFFSSSLSMGRFLICCG